MLTIGSLVRVLAPFDASFPGVYVITDMPTPGEDGQQVYVLSNQGESDGGLGGFDARYLEAAS